MITRTATVAAAALLAIPLSPTAAAEDTYADYAELAANETEGTDYERTTRAGDTNVAHIAIHGGGIGPATSELADYAAETGDHAYAAFERDQIDGQQHLAHRLHSFR